MPLYVSAGKIKKLWRTDDDAVLYEIKNLWTDQGQVFSSGPTIEVFEVSASGTGNGVFHSLIELSPPPGEVWGIEIEGTFTQARSANLMVGGVRSGGFNAGPAAWSGEITSADSRVGVYTTSPGSSNAANFVGTVTVIYPD